jgi:mannose-6-phosphate isomerase-like protein (cupin superfamily)
VKLPVLKGLVDSTPAESVFVRLAEHHAGRRLPDTGIDSAAIFECPRSSVLVRTAVKGTAIGAHFHPVCDEVVVVTGGSGELFINGEWKATRAGDVHVCPRGVVHDTRALAENLQYLSIFTPHPPPGGDVNFVE